MKQQSNIIPESPSTLLTGGIGPKSLVESAEDLSKRLKSTSAVDIGLTFFSSEALGEAIQEVGWSMLKHVRMLVAFSEDEKLTTQERRSAAREIRALIRDNLIVEGRMREFTNRAEINAVDGKIVIESTGLQLIQDAGRATEMALLADSKEIENGTRRSSDGQGGDGIAGRTSARSKSQSGGPGGSVDTEADAPRLGSSSADGVAARGELLTPGERRRRRAASTRKEEGTSEEVVSEEVVEAGCDDIGGSLPEGYARKNRDGSAPDAGSEEEEEEAGHRLPTAGGSLGICASADDGVLS